MPQDAVEEILARCGPSTLRNLRVVCRAFRACLDASPSIWRAARRNVLIDVALPPSGPREASLANLMFGVGPCFNCRRPTSVMPHSFSLGIRLCSYPCEYTTLKMKKSAEPVPELPLQFPVLMHANTLPVALPYLEGSAASPLYLPSAVRAAWHDFFKLCKAGSSQPLMPQITPSHQSVSPAFTGWMATAEKLAKCSVAYREAKAAVDTKNEALIRQLAVTHNCSFEQMLLSPTLTRHVNAFARDLEVLAPTVWESIKPSVCEEIRLRTSWATGQTPCPFCSTGGRPRLFTDRGLKQHFNASHGEDMAEDIVLADIRCSLCPRSDKVYNRVTLVNHLKTCLYVTRLSSASHLPRIAAYGLYRHC
ncbi:hypothetical protein DFH06DRAFT_1486831 [Mycena polygramma]|nr:hypothetical protein DFH06DRAFT_1486831 [Mycena polygramma]